MRAPKPTHTSYAVLGLMAIRPWTAYELAGQSERSLRWFFPRAERGVYLEVKRLAALGWAHAERSGTGRRPSTVYRISPAGRQALDDWLASECAPTQISSEAALKVFLSDQTTPAVLSATVRGVRESAEASLSRLAAMAGEHVAGRGKFPERAVANALSMKLITDLQKTLRAWGEWAESAAAQLQAGGPEAGAQLADAVFREIAASGGPAD